MLSKICDLKKGFVKPSAPLRVEEKQTVRYLQALKFTSEWAWESHWEGRKNMVGQGKVNLWAFYSWSFVGLGHKSSVARVASRAMSWPTWLGSCTPDKSFWWFPQRWDITLAEMAYVGTKATPREEMGLSSYYRLWWCCAALISGKRCHLSS